MSKKVVLFVAIIYIGITSITLARFRSSLSANDVAYIHGIVDTDKNQDKSKFEYLHDGIIRGNRTRQQVALVFTGDSYGDGGEKIRAVLKKYQVKGSFFLTGNFYRHPQFSALIKGLAKDGHYLGAHSDRHLLYCPWENRDSLLVNRQQFIDDLAQNYAEMARFGITRSQARYFLPPYEWYNTRISTWCKDFGVILVNFTPGTRSHADWTTPDLGQQYVTSAAILQSIFTFEQTQTDGLNGFILLSHIGSHPDRTDKFYHRLEDLVSYLIEKGYQLKRIDELLDEEEP